jgi:hypothetical protein
MANRLVDLLITYRIIKGLATPFDQTDAFKQGIIDKTGKVLIKSKDLTTEKQKDSYTVLDRFIFNMKRLLGKVGLGSSFGSFAVALAFILKENEELQKHKSLIESTVISYLKQIDVYDKLISEVKEIKEHTETPIMTCFGIDIYEKNGKLVTEYEKI